MSVRVLLVPGLHDSGPRHWQRIWARERGFGVSGVLSSDDPYVRPDVARALAAAWGSDVTDIGPAGHINTDSGHGPWPEGLRLLEPWLLD